MESVSTAIPDLVKSCLAAFKSLQTSTSARDNGSVAISHWEDEAGRFRVWSGNLAAHQTGSASLSYRLRHAASIKDVLIETLEFMLEVIKDITSILSDGSFSDDDQSYVEELYGDVVNSIDGLFRLTTIIRNPSRRDQILQRTEIDDSMEPFDKEHVRNKLHAASETLVDRLGRANTQRRANFRYLQRRHEKFLQGLDDDLPDDQEADLKSRMSGTIATELPLEVAVMQPRQSEDDDISVTASATSYASSLFTDAARRFPTMPQSTTNDGRFECPLCFYLIKAKTISAWRKHIFVDLQPYVCLLSNCSQAYKLFSSRHEWFAHEIDQHGRSAGDQNHCPLCNDDIPPRQAEKHLGRHLEDIALFTLPASLFEDDENEVGMEDDSEKDSVSDVEEDADIGISEVTNSDDPIVPTTIEGMNAQLEGYGPEPTTLVKKLLHLLRLDRDGDTATRYDRMYLIDGVPFTVDAAKLLIQERNITNVDDMIDRLPSQVPDSVVVKPREWKSEHERATFYAKMAGEVKAASELDFGESGNRPGENSPTEIGNDGSAEVTRLNLPESDVQQDSTPWIRCQVKYLVPETLEEYNLPWEFDPTNAKYLLIKQNIDHDLQQKLFDHTKTVQKRRRELSKRTSEEERPTYIRCHTKHLLPETLEQYKLPWEYDPEDEDYIVITQMVDHEGQKALFKHTKALKKQRRAVPEQDFSIETPTTSFTQTKHISPETLDAYNLPWEFDPIDNNYIIIKQYISEEFRDELSAHTKAARESSSSALEMRDDQDMELVKSSTSEETVESRPVIRSRSRGDVSAQDGSSDDDDDDDDVWSLGTGKKGKKKTRQRTAEEHRKKEETAAYADVADPNTLTWADETDAIDDDWIGPWQSTRTGKKKRNAKSEPQSPPRATERDSADATAAEAYIKKRGSVSDDMTAENLRLLATPQIGTVDAAEATGSTTPTVVLGAEHGKGLSEDNDSIAEDPTTSETTVPYDRDFLPKYQAEMRSTKRSAPRPDFEGCEKCWRDGMKCNLFKETEDGHPLLMCDRCEALGAFCVGKDEFDDGHIPESMMNPAPPSTEANLNPGRHPWSGKIDDEVLDRYFAVPVRQEADSEREASDAKWKENKMARASSNQGEPGETLAPTGLNIDHSHSSEEESPLSYKETFLEERYISPNVLRDYVPRLLGPNATYEKVTGADGTERYRIRGPRQLTEQEVHELQRISVEYWGQENALALI